MWYWKDLLNKAGIDPNSLQTWDGYIASARKINSVLGPMGISGAVLVGLNYSPDIWYPYLWMLGGDILVMKDGHPTKGTTGFLHTIAQQVLKRWNYQRTDRCRYKTTESNPDKLFVDRKLPVCKWILAIRCFSTPTMANFWAKCWLYTYVSCT